MKKVFTHENRLIVFNIKNVLEDGGIECLIKNEFASGGVGDLAAFETWPEIWITDIGQFEQAQQVIDKMFSHQVSGDDWVCTNCGETNAENFTICWNCNQAFNQPGSTRR